MSRMDLGSLCATYLLVLLKIRKLPEWWLSAVRAETLFETAKVYGGADGDHITDVHVHSNFKRSLNPKPGSDPMRRAYPTETPKP